MLKLILQAGHENRTSGQTGAPEEQANNIRIRNRLGEVLSSKGFQVMMVDADYTATQDFQLALSLHCDANYAGDEGGGFVDYPDPSVDFANAESKRIKEAIESEYFKNSGIKNMPNRSNANTKFYYWWSQLTKNTPCVLIEMGESIDPHDRVILADTDRVANAIARGVCRAFNVSFDPPPPPAPPVVPPPPVEPSIPPEPVQPPISPVPGPSVDYTALLNSVKVIIWGKGFWWTKINNLKKLLPK